MGEDLCALAVFKCALLGIEDKLRDGDGDVAEGARRLSERFDGEHHSPFWRADALCVAVAGAMRRGGHPGQRGLLDIARDAVCVVGRQDKLDIAIRVGEGDISPSALFAE